MSKKKITNDTFFVPFNIDRQLITEENSKFMFITLGKQIMSCIKREKLIIPEDNFLAYVHVKFICEKDYEEKVKYLDSE